MSEDRFKYVSPDGVVDIDRLRADGYYPTDERLAQGPVAVFECGQEIPCNPCEAACKKKCISIGDDITRIPTLEGDCTGCGLCLPECPGLAVFILDATYSETEATVTMPYELLPLPAQGDLVDALDRRGEKVCDATVVSAKALGKNERCRSLTVAIATQYIHDVRHIRRRST